MAPILLGIVHEAEYPVARDGVAVSSIVVAIELALVHVTTHVPHHAGHPVSNPDLSTNNGIAMMIGEPGLVVHWPRVFSLLDVQAVEGLAIDTDLGCAEREVTRIRIDGLGGIVMTAPPTVSIRKVAAMNVMDRTVRFSMMYLPFELPTKAASKLVH